MTSLSFSAAVKTNAIAVAAPALNPFDEPFDKNLGFNRVIQQNDKRPEKTVYSINPASIRTKLTSDDLAALQKITLACQYTQGGVGMWDTAFETIRRDGVTACVFVAGNDFSPLPQSRCRMVSEYLDLTKWVSRLHFNRVEAGDKLGIAVYDARKRVYYALIYSVAGICTVQTPAERNRESLTVPGANCELIQVYKVDTDGSALRLDVDEATEVTEKQEAFVSYLINTVNNVTQAYPWKPHFLPLTDRSFNRDQIEERLKTSYEAAVECSYEEFEELCRQTYAAEAVVHRNTPRVKGERPKGERGTKLPVVEAVLRTIDNRYQVTLADATSTEVGTYLFPVPEAGETTILENALLNHDLVGRSLIDAPGVLALSEDVFGAESTLRYFSVNF